MTVAVDVDRLLEALNALVGKSVIVEESISRNRELGHDRHCATYSQFRFQVRRITTSFSGMQVVLEGDESRYAIAAQSIARVTFEPQLVIDERFDPSIERRTTLRISHDHGGCEIA